MRRRALVSIAAGTFVLWSSRAFALCPNCLGQTRTLTPTLRLLGAFLLVPFVITYLVARFIRRACRATTQRG